MSIRKKINLGLVHKKTVKILQKQGMCGLLITEAGGEVITSAFGLPAHAFNAMHQAFNGVDWLNGLIKAVAAGPKITLEGPDGTVIEGNLNDGLEELSAELAQEDYVLGSEPPEIEPQIGEQ